MSAGREGPHVVLRIKDEGLGIAPDMLERIFEPFVQQRRPDPAVGGLGLGLTIVRALVAAHNGAVRVTSGGENLGSEFVIELPATDKNIPSAIGGSAARLSGPAPPSATRVRLLMTMRMRRTCCRSHSKARDTSRRLRSMVHPLLHLR